MRHRFILLKSLMVLKKFSGEKMEKNLLASFVDLIIANSDYQELDRTYLNNRIIKLVGEEVLTLKTTQTTLLALKDELVQCALKNQHILKDFASQDCLSAELLDFITPLPSVLNARFQQAYQKNKTQAIADFYALSKQTDYIKTEAIAKNIYFKTNTFYGDLEITINLAKPEKDPKQIALAKNVKQTGYPLCQLCFENEGYYGRLDFPARSNHRIIRFALGKETWGFQYSPYAYFNEHCIFLSTKHEPMVIDKQTFINLLEIVEYFPGYFVGSNADLPIVGGSILTHAHYQGGRHMFAMQKAEVEKTFTFKGYSKIKAGIVKWPMSVIRLQGKDKAQLSQLAAHILMHWQNYSDESVGILATSKGQKHHTITPIARKCMDEFVFDLVLRDNQTSAKYPDGIYHPHPDVQHIKKENIGLIEVMGLAILPPRLKEELKQVKQYLLGQDSKVAKCHQAWAEELKTKYANVNLVNVTEILQTELGQVFVRVLEDAGVFKRDQMGQQAFMRFIKSIGID